LSVAARGQVVDLPVADFIAQIRKGIVVADDDNIFERIVKPVYPSLQIPKAESVQFDFRVPLELLVRQGLTNAFDGLPGPLCGAAEYVFEIASLFDNMFGH
jgi:hypothetical protein